MSIQCSIKVQTNLQKEPICLDLEGLSEGDFPEILKDYVDEPEEVPVIEWEVIEIENCETEWLLYGNNPDHTTWEWVWLEYFGQTNTLTLEQAEAANTLDITPDNCEECYRGEFRTTAEFAQEVHERVGETVLNNWPYNHIDWESAGEELLGNDYSECQNHYFCNY